ncbi:peptidoglycan bridge formation glycyltransferase FemA/FemB family protein [Thalassospira sp. SM2505]
MNKEHNGITIIPLSPDYYDQYDIFCREHPDCLIYYTRRYGHFLSVLLGCEKRYWIAVDDNKNIVGILPLMKSCPQNGQSVLNSLPFFGSHGGILACRDDASKELLSKYIKETEDASVIASTIVENPLRPLGSDVPATYMDYRISQITNIDLTEEQLFSSFDGSARRNIKKALRNNINVVVNNNAWCFLESTHRENISAIGGKTKSSDFFVSVKNGFRESVDYNIYVAMHGAECISALLLLYFNDTVEYFVPGTLHDARSLHPLPLVIFRAMVEARENGYKKWNWGGTWQSQGGVYQFKKKFAAIDGSYRYFTLLKDKALLRKTPKFIDGAFPNFYVVPYNELNNTVG